MYQGKKYFAKKKIIDLIINQIYNEIIDQKQFFGENENQFIGESVNKNLKKRKNFFEKWDDIISYIDKERREKTAMMEVKVEILT